MSTPFQFSISELLVGLLFLNPSIFALSWALRDNQPLPGVALLLCDFIGLAASLYVFRDVRQSEHYNFVDTFFIMLYAGTFIALFLFLAFALMLSILF